MTTPARQRKLRTFSAFGDVRRMPTEYEIVTHSQNWTTREGRLSTCEQNPSSPLNLWFMTYREKSPLRCDSWETFRDPDQVAYRSYVNMQAEEQTKLATADGFEKPLPPPLDRAYAQRVKIVFLRSMHDYHA